MTQDGSRFATKELAYLPKVDADPTLAALQVAIYLEDALGIVIPSHLLNWEHLGSLEAVQRTLIALEGP